MKVFKVLVQVEVEITMGADSQAEAEAMADELTVADAEVMFSHPTGPRWGGNPTRVETMDVSEVKP